MSARQKLNIAFFNGSLLLAGVAGLIAQSWLVFGLVLAVLVVANLCRDEIRVSKSKRRGPPA